jgi:drug/metabolite transporter (DMT)-like permease
VLLGLGAALIAAVLYGVASILQATGARRVASSEGLDPRLVLRLLQQPAFLGALGMTLFGFLFHLLAVRTIPLFLAQAGIAVSLVVTALLAVRIFDDHLSRIEWAAIGAVVVGLVLLSASAGDAGTERAYTGLTVSLYAILVGMLAVGFVAGRSDGIVATAVLGLLGGLGYAVVGISSRILPDFVPLDLLGSPATYSLALGGGLAFYLYSMALQRGSAIAATTPLIAVQTVTPAAVGVLLLGDQVRPGWWPGAIVGFTITAAAAIVLVRFEGVRAAEATEGGLVEDLGPRRGPGPAGGSLPAGQAGASVAEFAGERDRDQQHAQQHHPERDDFRGRPGRR